MKAFFFLISLVSFVYSGEILQSERVTTWGTWGAFEKCPNGTFAQGFMLKTEPYKGPLIDDTASNAVRLYCGDPFNINTKYIQSSEGHKGIWGQIYTCRPGGYIYGFQHRVEAAHLVSDETATNNFRFFCTNDEPDTFLEGDGERWGIFRETSIRKCARTEGICGLQTQVEPSHLGDNTSLNNIAAECCDLPK